MTQLWSVNYLSFMILFSYSFCTGKHHNVKLMQNSSFFLFCFVMDFHWMIWFINQIKWIKCQPYSLSRLSAVAGCLLLLSNHQIIILSRHLGKNKIQARKKNKKFIHSFNINQQRKEDWVRDWEKNCQIWQNKKKKQKKNGLPDFEEIWQPAEMFFFVFAFTKKNKFWWWW